MNKDELFSQYQKYILELRSLTEVEDNSQKTIAQKERNSIAEIEKTYLKVLSELQSVKQTVDEQYKSIWESCTVRGDLRKPEAQRPLYTDVSWQECIKVQEQEAKKIQKWFLIKTQQAVAEKQRKLQQEEAQRTTSALLAAEAERKRKKEAEAIEKIKGAALLEKMKNKYKKIF